MEQNLKARDSFVANITHELRTPVNGIKGHVKNLLDLETEPSKKSTLGIIIQCCNNMEKIINNLLDFSKMEAGKFEICENRLNSKLCQSGDGYQPASGKSERAAFSCVCSRRRAADGYRGRIKDYTDYEQSAVQRIEVYFNGGGDTGGL